MPVLILSMKENNHQRKPAVVFLHSTNKAKEWLRPLLEVNYPNDFFRALSLHFFCIIRMGQYGDLFFSSQAYASRGYVAIAIDSRYHGERASSKTTYRDVCILYLYSVFLLHNSIIFLV